MGRETKIYYAGEDQQQFTRPIKFVFKFSSALLHRLLFMYGLFNTSIESLLPSAAVNISLGIIANYVLDEHLHAVYNKLLCIFMLQTCHSK
jgi:hypothetical protein